MKILIVGGAGYIGSTLTLQALLAGHTVMVADTCVYGQGPSLYYLSSFHGKYSLHNIDIRDTTGISHLAEDADVVFLLAAIVGAPACDKYPEIATQINLDAIRNLMQHLSPNQRIIFPNTNSGYGTVPEGICTEDTPFQPISLYARTKCEAEDLVMQHPLATVFRLATVFGISPRMRLDLLVNDLTYRAVFQNKIEIFDAGLRRNFVHVVDIAKCFLESLDNHHTYGNIFNFGQDGANMTKGQLGELIAEITGASLVFGTGHDPDRRDYMVSSDKLRKVGIEAKISLDSGIQELASAFKELLPVKAESRSAVVKYMSTKEFYS